MSKVLAVLIALCALSCGDNLPDAGASWPPPVAEGALVGVFEGKFPCETCNRLKTALQLRQDPATRDPTTYDLREIYVGLGDDIFDSRGTWTVVRGMPSDPTATIYELHPNQAGALVRYLSIDDNLLLLLDDELKARIGNATHSFTLSRTR